MAFLNPRRNGKTLSSRNYKSSTKENATDTGEQISTDYTVALSLQEQDLEDLIKASKEDADDEISTGSNNIAAIYAAIHSNTQAQISTHPMTTTDSAAEEDPRDTDYSDMPALGSGNPFAALQSDGKEEANEEPHSMVEPEANKDAKQEAKESTGIVPPTSSSTTLVSTDAPTDIITYASVASSAAHLPVPHPIFKMPGQFRKVLSKKDKRKLKKEEKCKKRAEATPKKTWCQILLPSQYGGEPSSSSGISSSESNSPDQELPTNQGGTYPVHLRTSQLPAWFRHQTEQMSTCYLRTLFPLGQM